MSTGRVPFAAAYGPSRKDACAFSRKFVSRGLTAVAAALALFMPVPQAQAQASLNANPSAVNFSPLMLGFVSPLVLVTITNTGTVPLTHITFKIEGAAPHDFTMTPGPCMTLQPQQPCTKGVRFRPTAVGARSAALWIDSAELGPQSSVQLTGMVLAPAPKLWVSTDELDFNPQADDSTSAPLTVQLFSVGAQNLDITALSIAPAGQFILAPASDCSVSPLATPLTGLNPASCTVSVEFTPNGPGPVERMATLTIGSTDPDGPKQVKLHGEIAQPLITVNPSSIQFGHAFIGDPSLGVDGSVEITNIGSADLVITSQAIANGIPNLSDFSFVPNASSALPCTVKANSGPGCTFKIRFIPHGTGDRLAELKFSTSPLWNLNIILHGIGDLALPLPTPPPIGAATDVLFCSAVPPAAPQSCAGAGELLLQTIPVTRAFGSNNPGVPFIPQPTVATAVLSGTLGPAVLEIMALGLGPPGTHSVILNSKTIGTITVPGSTLGNSQWGLATIAIPPALIPTAIFFPGVAPIGSAPTPLTNILAITPDAGNSGACIAVAWARLRIKAMSPVIMIHGMNSNGAFFSRQAIAGGVTLIGPPAAFTLGPTPGSFLAAGIPTDTSINLPGTASVAANAAILSTLIPGIVRSFGASNVHIVAHDKGGLDARAWLSVNAAIDKARAVAPFSVISFTTLSTPHQGTAAADLQVALAASVLEVLPVAALGALGFSVVNPAVLDLTTFAAPGLAAMSPLPTGVDYRSVGGDPDRNFNGLIQSRPLPDEYIAERIEQPTLAGMFAINPPATDVAVTSVYQFMFTTRTVVVTPVFIPIPVPPFFIEITVPTPVPGIPSLNDLLVTTSSALFSSSFSPLPAFVGASGVDHASVAGPRVGAAIIPLLVTSDTTKGGLR